MVLPRVETNLNECGDVVTTVVITTQAAPCRTTASTKDVTCLPTSVLKRLVCRDDVDPETARKVNKRVKKARKAIKRKKKDDDDDDATDAGVSKPKPKSKSKPKPKPPPCTPQPCTPQSNSFSSPPSRSRVNLITDADGNRPPTFYRTRFTATDRASGREVATDTNDPIQREASTATDRASGREIATDTNDPIQREIGTATDRVSGREASTTTDRVSGREASTATDRASGREIATDTNDPIQREIGTATDRVSGREAGTSTDPMQHNFSVGTMGLDMPHELEFETPTLSIGADRENTPSVRGPTSAIVDLESPTMSDHPQTQTQTQTQTTIGQPESIIRPERERERERPTVAETSAEMDFLPSYFTREGPSFRPKITLEEWRRTRKAFLAVERVTRKALKEEEAEARKEAVREAERAREEAERIKEAERKAKEDRERVEKAKEEGNRKKIQEAKKKEAERRLAEEERQREEATRVELRQKEDKMRQKEDVKRKELEANIKLLYGEMERMTVDPYNSETRNLSAERNMPFLKAFGITSKSTDQEIDSVLRKLMAMLQMRTNLKLLSDDYIVLADEIFKFLSRLKAEYTTLKKEATDVGLSAEQSEKIRQEIYRQNELGEELRRRDEAAKAEAKEDKAKAKAAQKAAERKQKRKDLVDQQRILEEQTAQRLAAEQETKKRVKRPRSPSTSNNHDLRFAETNVFKEKKRRPIEGSVKDKARAFTGMTAEMRKTLKEHKKERLAAKIEQDIAKAKKIKSERNRNSDDTSVPPPRPPTPPPQQPKQRARVPQRNLASLRPLVLQYNEIKTTMSGKNQDKDARARAVKSWDISFKKWWNEYGGNYSGSRKDASDSIKKGAGLMGKKGNGKKKGKGKKGKGKKGRK